MKTGRAVVAMQGSCPSTRWTIVDKGLPIVDDEEVATQLLRPRQVRIQQVQTYSMYDEVDANWRGWLRIGVVMSVRPVDNVELYFVPLLHLRKQVVFNAY